MTKDSDSTRRIDILLGGVRAAIRKADEAFRPDPDAALYVGTDDGRINLADLLALAPTGMDPGDGVFARLGDLSAGTHGHGPGGLRAPRQHPV